MRWPTTLFLMLFLMLFLPSNAQALQTLSGEYISVNSPIDDDVFATGGTVNINAPISGAVIAGGTVNINAPVSGDVFAAGGQVNVNSNIGGKIVAAGGRVDLRGDVGTNAVIAGGKVKIHTTCVIGKDAAISGGSVYNAGRINGNLTVRAKDFQNTGSAGRIDFEKNEGLKGMISLARILVSAGFLIPGIALLRLFPAQFFKVEEHVRKAPIKNTLVGFALIVASSVLILLLALTIIGFPTAAIMGMLFAIALMLSTLFVSFTVGRKIISLFKLETNDMVTFILGFVVLNVLYGVPYAGGLIYIVSVSLGFGAIVYALRESHKDSNPEIQ